MSNTFAGAIDLHLGTSFQAGIMIGTVDQVIGILILVLLQGGQDDPLLTGLFHAHDMDGINHILAGVGIQFLDQRIIRGMDRLGGGTIAGILLCQLAGGFIFKTLIVQSFLLEGKDDIIITLQGCGNFELEYTGSVGPDGFSSPFV